MFTSRYPEGWIDPEIFGGLVALGSLVVLIIVAAAFVIKSFLDN